MAKLLMLIAGSVALARPMPAFAQDPIVIYVSPNGSDTNDGTSPGQSFATPERAEAELAKRGPGTIYLLSGVYDRKTTMMIPKGSPPQKWAAYQGGRPIFDGGGKVFDGIRIMAGGVVIDGLTIENFANNGISAFDSPNVTISNNHIMNISSARWGQAGILIIGNSPHNTITGNEITNTGYAGIEVYGNAGNNTSETLIANNILSETCRTKDDCGAIYVSGRTAKSDGTVIKNNKIHDYGATSLQKTFGIYLDDFASHMKITGNSIDGSGSNPILLHGGRDDQITDNKIGLSPGQQALYYDSLSGPRMSDMRGNHFDRNIIRGARDKSALVKITAPGKLSPSLTSNQIDR